MNRADRIERGVGRLAIAALCITVGLGLGVALDTPSRDLIGQADAAALLASQADSGSDADYSFFTNRRYLWIVKRSTGQAQFFHVPEITSSEQPMQKSRVYQVDAEDFPLDQVHYQVSERNLELFLWLTDPTNGKVRFVRARRDGGFDQSPIVDPSSDM